MGPSTVAHDPRIIDLNRLLASQERTLLSQAAALDAFKSKFQRARIRANLDYSRSLLLTISSTKEVSKDDIQRKRDTIKRLQARLNELDRLFAHEEDLDDGCGCCSSDEEQNSASLKPSESLQKPEGIRQRATATTTTPTPELATTTSSNRYAQALPPKIANSRPDEDEATSIKSREGKLASHDREREALQTSLLDLAVQLKQSARGFSASIEGEKDTIDATVLGLDRSVGGMEGAGGKLEKLRKETEGAGWFRRVRLYAEVAGLWLLVVLLVFVFPKLRF